MASVIEKAKPDASTEQSKTELMSEIIDPFLEALLLDIITRGAVDWHRPADMLHSILQILEISAEHARVRAIEAEIRARTNSQEWICPHCDESVPGTFDICWNCFETP